MESTRAGRLRLFQIGLGTLLLLGWLGVACEGDGASSTIPAASVTGTPTTSPPIATGPPATESTVSAEPATATALPEPALEIIHNPGRVLTLRVLPQAAPMVQHQSETIRQRVSVAAGGDSAARHA